ncbi:hypothetical protein OAS86_04205 [Gammaproteobacteria bacterium]|nr:hypothetical protein [Gammaproteobacteria bacterium]
MPTNLSDPFASAAPAAVDPAVSNRLPDQPLSAISLVGLLVQGTRYRALLAYPEGAVLVDSGAQLAAEAATIVAISADEVVFQVANQQRRVAVGESFAPPSMDPKP